MKKNLTLICLTLISVNSFSAEGTRDGASNSERVIAKVELNTAPFFNKPPFYNLDNDLNRVCRRSNYKEAVHYELGTTSYEVETGGGGFPDMLYIDSNLQVRHVDFQYDSKGSKTVQGFCANYRLVSDEWNNVGPAGCVKWIPTRTFDVYVFRYLKWVTCYTGYLRVPADPIPAPTIDGKKISAKGDLVGACKLLKFDDYISSKTERYHGKRRDVGVPYQADFGIYHLAKPDHYGKSEILTEITCARLHRED